MAAQGAFAHVETAFLEMGRPDLQGAVATLAAAGVQRIVILPYFLTLGMHLQRDLPKLAEQARAEHRNIEIEIAPPLDGHPAMVEALLGRANDAAKSEAK
jgi:sirohydrochlorin cobaltochelatase